MLLLTRPYARVAAADAARAVKPISLDEGEFLRWNSDPFDLDGGSGGSETDPGDCSRMIRPLPVLLAVTPHSVLLLSRLLHLAVLDGEVRAAARFRFSLVVNADRRLQVLQAALICRRQRVRSVLQ